MTTQQQLPIGTPLEMMRARLQMSGRVFARELERLFKWDDRMCREIANASRGEIISGNWGYALNRETEEAEYQKSRHRLRGMALDMLRRIKEQDEHRYGANQLTLPQLVEELEREPDNEL